jgi:primosomal protein N' (replication factor Y) (superfamily II helicase)
MTLSPDRDEQLTLLKRRVRTQRPKPVTLPAAVLPVARVAVDLPLAHLDRPFDYSVLEPMAEAAVPGCRVKVRFAGRDVDGFLLERVDSSDHGGQLAPLRRVVSPEPVLTPQVMSLTRATADRYAGTLADVLRLAVPPRHARVEAEVTPHRVAQLDVPVELLVAPWSDTSAGEALVRHLVAGEAPRAVWTAKPGDDWPARLAAAAAATRAAGRGSILCLPDARDVARLDDALTVLLGAGSHVVLTADLGPAARYRAFLAALRGQAPIVIGTRAAAFAPVSRLGLVAMWDDGDDLFAEPRAPYPFAREVLVMRAHLERCALLLGAHARSVVAQQLVESGWAVPVTAAREVVRAAAPLVHVAGESDHELERDAAVGATRMPRRVFEVVRAALKSGPVLVHAPRLGYQPALACASCRQPARCPACAGPLQRQAAHQPPVCRWCAAVARDWSCPSCGAATFSAPVVGSLRTAQEWGRSFPRTTVLTSGGDSVLDSVSAEPAVVIATPGAEPRASPPGYAAAVLLDTWLTLARPAVGATEEALRRWLNVGAQVRSAADGGRVVVVGEHTMPVLQAFVRWDPEGFASRELADRTSARLPPAARTATITAAPDILADALTQLVLPPAAQMLGPVEIGPDSARVVIRMPRSRGPQLTRALQQLQSARSARKLPPIRVQVDPDELA